MSTAFRFLLDHILVERPPLYCYQVSIKKKWPPDYLLRVDIPVEGVMFSHTANVVISGGTFSIDNSGAGGGYSAKRNGEQQSIYSPSVNVVGKCLF